MVHPNSKKRKRSGAALMLYPESKKRKMSGAALKATKDALGYCQNTLRVSGLPFYATEAHVEEFFGMLLDTHMDYVVERRTEKDCYVRFDDEESALKALHEKNNQPCLGSIVSVDVSRLTLASLRKKETYCVIRQVPYSSSLKNTNIEANIRKEYRNILGRDCISDVTVEGYSKNSGCTCSYKYAIITFSDESYAAEVMNQYEENLQKKPIVSTTAGEEGISNFIKSCEVQKFWVTGSQLRSAEQAKFGNFR